MTRRAEMIVNRNGYAVGNAAWACPTCGGREYKIVNFRRQAPWRVWLICQREGCRTQYRISKTGVAILGAPREGDPEPIEWDEGKP